MKDFEFIFEGKVTSDGGVNSGIKLLRGDAIDIAHTLGMYADGALKQLKEPHAAIIVLNAFKKFMELNPDMAPDIIDRLVQNDGARIVQPAKKDLLNIDPKSGFRKK